MSGSVNLNIFTGARAMNTPVYDYLISYAESGTLRMHMPGHKGKKADNELSEIFRLDLTEITDAGNLFSDEGIIAESERNATELFGTKATFYSTGGSTQCIQTMLALVKREGRKVIAVRNVHRAFLSACTLLDIDPEWIMPEYTDTYVSGQIPLCSVEEKLKTIPDACLYVTSPDYLGAMADIKTLADLCHRYGAVLIVDNAHGGLLPFYSENRHPVHLGADLCCDSAHKMLPALTGAAYLHVGNERYVSKVKEAMLLFASTSPSYLITCSLDLCNRYIADEIRKRLADAVKWTDELRMTVEKRYVISYPAFDRDDLHFTVNAAKSGIKGSVLAAYLRENGIEYEYADDTYIVMLFSPCDDHDAYLKVADVLMKADFIPEYPHEEKFFLPPPDKIMTIREAAFRDYEEIPANKAVGRICASLDLPCPPAVPIAVSGELISPELAEIMQSFGIDTVRIVKNDIKE